MTSKWDETETTLVSLLDTYLPSSFEAQRTGGSNSTQPDIVIKHNGTLFTNIEVKLLPSVAGIQTVVQPSEANTFTTTQKLPYSEHMITLVRSLPEAHGTQQIPITGNLSEIAYEALHLKYANSNVRYLIGDTGLNIPNRYILCETNINDLRNHLTLSFLVRAKKSGSGGLPARLKPAVETLLTNKVACHHENNRLKISNLDEIYYAQQLVDKLNENLFVNKTGEIRKLGTTNNLTALLSLNLNPKLSPTQYLTGQQIATIIAENGN